MTYRYMDEQLGFPHQTSGHRPKRPLPQRDIIAAQRQAELAARKQALAESRQRRTRPQPVVDDIEDDLAIDGDEWEVPRMPAVTRRYDLTPGEYYHQTPLRRSAPVTQAPAPTPRRQLQLHWFVYVGIALILVLIGWMAYGPITTAWQVHTDDVTYGNPRTYQVDAVVGHNDSSSNPSHFIAENLRGHYFVEELPGGDISKAVFYHFPTDIGNGNPPITISFQDFDNDGLLDMIVKIGDPGSQVTYMMQNDGKQFVNKG